MPDGYSRTRHSYESLNLREFFDFRSDLAWNTAKSAHGPWRLSRSPALAFAFTHAYFKSLGLPDLFDYSAKL